MRRRLLFRLCWVAALVGIWLLRPVWLQAQEKVLEQSFDDPTLTGWERSENAVVADGVLRIEGSGFAHCPVPVAQSTISLRFRVEGEGHVEIHYLRSDPSSFVLLLTPGETALFEEVEGQRLPLNATDAGFAVPGWHHLEIRQAGAEHHILLDAGIELDATSERSLPSGGLMFHSFGEAVVEFDDLVITGPGVEGGEVPAEEPPVEGAPPGPTSPPPAPPGQLSWLRTGGPPGGLGYDIRYNFDDPNIWYVTDFNAGVNISTDNGLTWHPSNTGIASVGAGGSERYPIFSLTVDPHNPQILWTGTDINGHIYKSTDGGLTWTKKDNGVTVDYEGLSFRGFTVHPETSDIVFAMAETSRIGNNVWGDGVGGVVYKTVDGGEHWEVIWDGGMPSSLARYMWINPEDPDVLYVSTGIFDRGAVGEGNPDTDADPWGGLGILKSEDGGKTWRTLGKDNGLDFLYVGSLYMHPDDPDILLAAAGHVAGDPAIDAWNRQGHSPMGIYRTTDGGENWVQVLAAPLDMIASAFSSVEICPFHHNVVYAGSESGVFRSDDAGLTWTKTMGGADGWGPPGIAAGWPIDMQCDPRNPDRIFANNYQGGNFLSEDGGRTWVNASDGYTGAQLIDVEVDPSNAAHVFAAGRSGVWVSDDAGATWQGISNPGDTRALTGGNWGAAAIDPSDPEHVLLGGPEHILEWDAKQQVWQSRPLPPGVGPEIVAIHFAPSDPEIVYAGASTHNTMVHLAAIEGGQGVMVSVDGGSNWRNITGPQFSEGVILDIAVHPLDAGVVYVATHQGLYKTVDMGGSWSLVLEGGGPVRTVGVSPGDPDRILAGVEEVGLFLSTDGGAGWDMVVAGLEPNGSHRDILFDSATPSTIYLADLASGVYRSEDAGVSWMKLDAGLNVKSVTGLSLSGDRLHLYASTSGGGVYRLDLAGEPPQPGPTGPPVEIAQPAGTPTPTAVVEQPQPPPATPPADPPATEVARQSEEPPAPQPAEEEGGARWDPAVWWVIGLWLACLFVSVILVVVVLRQRRRR